MIIEEDGLIFECDTSIEKFRARTLLSKEPGTIEWLKNYTQKGSVVYDIGANIGVYTLFSAREVGSGGHVYAFEPHPGNVISLLRNVAHNKFQDRVHIITTPLGVVNGLQRFNHTVLAAGSSGHQLGHTCNEFGQTFTPDSYHMSYGVSIDTLRHDIQIANIIKIDVDGNELDILRGMKCILSENPPVSIQVEMHPSSANDIIHFMSKFNYGFPARHNTAIGEQQVLRGKDPGSIAYNAVFLLNIVHG